MSTVADRRWKGDQMKSPILASTFGKKVFVCVSIAIATTTTKAYHNFTNSVWKLYNNWSNANKLKLTKWKIVLLYNSIIIIIISATEATVATTATAAKDAIS